jgi:DNA-binding CsgD family transcriptional regulator
MPATAIIGREEELGAVQAFVGDLDQGPSALVLSGEPGIGKTILWEAGVAYAQERVGRVLTCRGVEAEASLSFAALSDLLSPVLHEAIPSLASPRRRALEVALLLAEPGDVAPDAHAIGLAVLDVLHVLAERAPVLVALDDAQWLDPASAGVLQIALRRLREEPIGLLATLRVSRDASSDFQLDRSFPDTRLLRLSLGPLSAGALHRLLEERLALELTRPELARIREASAGNPFFALELGRELVRTNTRPAPGQTLPVPESLRELLGGRLSRLPGETLDVLLQVAALARPTIEVVAAAHGDRERVLGGLEAAVREGVVELDDSRVRFAHPLLASICYEQAPLWKRRAVHRALAAAVSDVEERARHLALAADGPDTVAASYLDAAAEHAAARGATAAAAELSELAAELTPDDPPLSRQRRLRAATFHRLAGEGDQATALLDQLLTEVPSGAERADVLFALAYTFRGDPPTTNKLFDEALAQAAGDDARAARILGYRSLFRLLAADVHAALLDARAALEKAERVGDPALLAFVICRAGHAETWAGEITPGLLERGAEIEERCGLQLEFLDSPRAILTRLLMRLGEIDRPRAMLEELERTAATRGDEVSRVLVTWYLALLEWYAGRWQHALEHAAAAHELGAQTGFPHNLAWAGRVRALLEADLGLIDEARAHAEEGLAFSQSRQDEFFIIACLGALGRLELALGNLEAAGGYLRELPGRLLAGGVHDPGNPVWADAIETLVTLGDFEQARAYLDQYDLHARQLESPWAVAGAARCRGLLAGAEGDVQSAFAAFERSLAAGAPFPLERARTLLCLGVVRRQAQQKKAAREALEQALAIFEELGARLWAEKARAELRRISGRRAPTEELTETERRVAELAAAGRSNKEIAVELFMGVSTVEAHLSRVYRKLGIRSRAALASHLAMPVDAAAQG